MSEDGGADARRQHFRSSVPNGRERCARGVPIASPGRQNSPHVSTINQRECSKPREDTPSRCLSRRRLGSRLPGVPTLFTIGVEPLSSFLFPLSPSFPLSGRSNLFRVGALSLFRVGATSFGSEPEAGEGRAERRARRTSQAAGRIHPRGSSTPDREPGRVLTFDNRARCVRCECLPSARHTTTFPVTPSARPPANLTTCTRD